MKGLILQEARRFFPNLNYILTQLGDNHKNYNWLITDHECFTNDLDLVKLFEIDECWITGEELDYLFKKGDFQWKGGVLSGFSKDIKKDDVFKYDAPIWESPSFWKKPILIQHPLAEVEMVPWDGMLFLFLSKNDEYINQFKAAFPLAEDLERCNEST